LTLCKFISNNTGARVKRPLIPFHFKVDTNGQTRGRGDAVTGTFICSFNEVNWYNQHSILQITLQ